MEVKLSELTQRHTVFSNLLDGTNINRFKSVFHQASSATKDLQVEWPIFQLLVTVEPSNQIKHMGDWSLFYPFVSMLTCLSVSLQSFVCHTATFFYTKQKISVLKKKKSRIHNQSFFFFYTFFCVWQLTPPLHDIQPLMSPPITPLPVATNDPTAPPCSNPISFSPNYTSKD